MRMLKFLLVFALLLIEFGTVYSQQCVGTPVNPSSTGGSASGSSATPTPPSCQLYNGAQDSSGYNGPITFYIYGIGSWDPNLIVTPKGFETPKWVSVKDNLGINIYFENDPNLATAPVHNAYVYYPFNAKQNPASFRLGSFGFNGMVLNVPPGLNTYHQRLDLRDSLGLYVDVTAGINIVTNTAFWIFQSIDPLTNFAPTNPLKGFLPVKDTSVQALSDTAAVKGDGFVNFTISPYEGDKTGDTVYSKAKIVFDVNDTIPTNTDFNTIDAVAPSSNVSNANVSGNIIHISWNGTDDPGGSGIKDYSLFVSKDGAPYVFYKQFTGLSTDFESAPGSTYCFYTQARDNTGNLEPLKNGCELQIGGVAFPLTWLYFTGKRVNTYNDLNWATASEQNTAKFFIERSIDGISFTTISSKNAVGKATGTTSYEYQDYDAVRLLSPMFYYRLRQTDLDGKFTYSRIIAIANRTDNAPVVKVYPNPNTGMFAVEINSTIAASSGDRLELYDARGVLLYKKSIAGRPQNATYIINTLKSLASGMYYLSVIMKDARTLLPVVKH